MHAISENTVLQMKKRRARHRDVFKKNLSSNRFLNPRTEGRKHGQVTADKWNQ